MRDFPHAQVIIAPRPRRFPSAEPGAGQAARRWFPYLDYPLDDVYWEAARRALLAMAEIQFAAGAGRVTPVHEETPGFASWSEAKRGIADLRLKPCCAGSSVPM